MTAPPTTTPGGARGQRGQIVLRALLLVVAAGLLLFELLTGQPYLDAARDVDLVRIAEEPPRRKPRTG